MSADLIETLQKENDSLRKTLAEYGVSEFSAISDVEFICLNQIRRIKAASEMGELSVEQVKNLDTLNKTLQATYKKDPEKKLVKKETIGIQDLINIVEKDEHSK